MRRTEVGLLAESRFIDSPGRICQVSERSLTVAYALGECAFQNRAFAFKSLFQWLLDYHVGRFPRESLEYAEEQPTPSALIVSKLLL